MDDKEKSAGYRILIIDDNHNIFNDFQTILLDGTDTADLEALAADFFGESVDSDETKSGYELDYASQGVEGVEKVKQALSDNRPFALAFVDMRMPPGWDGLETIEHLWKVDPNVQIVICTAYSDYSWDEMNDRVGKTDRLLILKKPFDTAEVAQLASALTEKWDLSEKASIKMNEIEQMIKDRTLELEKTNKHLQDEINERKKTEEALKLSNKKILEQQKSVIEEERLKILLQLSGATALELNQPLTNLIENVHLIKDSRNVPEKMDHYMANIENIGWKISEIVEKIQTIHHDKPKLSQADASTIALDHEIKVLSVEDSEVDYALIKALLKKSSQITLFCETGVQKAIEFLHKEHVDLILLDYILPDGNGLDFIRLMETEGFDIPVVVITGQGDEMVASQIIQAGAYEYLPKDRGSVKALSRIITNTLEKARLKREIKEAQKMMAMMSTTDELTGLYNRRYFDEALEREVSRSHRYHTDLVLCITDLDHFKTINDTYSHLAGDMVLSRIGSLLRSHFRKSDLVCRYGGEEFAIIIPNTPINNAVKACEKFRVILTKQQFEYESNNFEMTMSIGVALLNNSEKTTHRELVSMADKALYQAKHEGRNRIVVYS